MEKKKKTHSRNYPTFNTKNQLHSHERRSHFFSFDKNEKSPLMIPLSKRKQSFFSTTSGNNIHSESTNFICDDLCSLSPTTDFRTESTLPKKCRTKIKNINQLSEKINTSLNYSDLDDEYVNINLIRRKTKCEQLKSEILLNEQKFHYSLKKTYEPTLILPKSSFIRKEIKINQYTPCLHYDKNNIFCKTNKIKQFFRNGFSEEDIRPKLRTRENDKEKKKRKMYDKIHKISVDAINSNKRIKRGILNCKIVKEKSSNDKKTIKKPKFKFIPSKNEEKCVIEMKSLVLRNSKKVKLHLDDKTGKLLDKVVNQLLVEDEILNKNMNENTEYEIKANQLRLLKEFKKVSYETISMKNKLTLEDFNAHPNKKEIDKLKSTVNKLRGRWDDEGYLKSEIQRANVLKKIQPLIPKSIKAIKAKRLCELVDE